VTSPPIQLSPWPTRPLVGRVAELQGQAVGTHFPFQLYEEGPWVLSSLLETAMAKAYSYLRFSTPEQMKGDSHRRQSTRAQEYAVRNHLDLDDKLTFHDLGVSGYRGKNSETGMLAEFRTSC
jgi:hypothetical protein